MKSGRTPAHSAIGRQAQAAPPDSLVVVRDEIIIFCSNEFAAAIGFAPEDLTGEKANRFFSCGPVLESASVPGSGDLVALFVNSGPNAGQLLFVESSEESGGQSFRLLMAQTPMVTAAAGQVKRPDPKPRTDSPTSINQLLDELLARTWRSVEHPPAVIERDYGLLPAIRAGRGDLSRVITRMVVLAERSLLNGDVVSVRTRSDGERAIVVINSIHEGAGASTAGSGAHRKALEGMFDLPGDEECDELLSPYGGVLALSDDGGYRATLSIPIHPKSAHETDTRRRDLITAQWTP